MKNVIAYISTALLVFMGVSTQLSTNISAISVAEQCGGAGSGSNSTICQSGNAEENVADVIKKITNAAFFIVGALAVIMIIYSGIRYVTSAGNPTGVTAAKNSLMYSVIGLVVAILAYAIVSFVVDTLV